jgi:signal transduction histidine kinase
MPMRLADYLSLIKNEWLERVSNRLAHGDNTREPFHNQINQFFDSLCQSLQSGDPSWLIPILDQWVVANTATDLDHKKTSLLEVINQLFQITYEVSWDLLDQKSAPILIGALIPVFNFASEYSAEQEIKLRIIDAEKELDKARITLERLDKSKSDFIAVAAHELKTPLTLIDGYTAMLGDILSGNELSQQTSLLIDGLNGGTKRLREIIDDMIDVSMIDNNLLSLSFQPFWLNHLLDQIINENLLLVSARHQTLEFKDFPGSNELNYGDSERLFQAISNVLSNAIKFTPDGGRIEIDGRKLPGFTEIIISDNGIGIDPEDHTRIFEKFGRLGDASFHSSGKTKYKGGGPGLGLPISKGIIEAHGGTIWVESDGYDEERFPGTKFHILIPVRTHPPDDKSAKLFRSLRDTNLALME